MIVYESTKGEFMDSVVSGSIADEIYDIFLEKIGRTTKSEFRAWENSMEFMYKVLNDNDIPDDSGVAIEFTIPTSSKRIDFILTGQNQDNSDSVVIIELKQWESAEKVEGKDAIVKTIKEAGLTIGYHANKAVSKEEFILAKELGGTRFGGGYNAPMSAKDLFEYVDKGISFEFSPAMYLKAGYVSSYNELPIKQLMAYGIKVGLYCDNMTFLQIDMFTEFAKLVKEHPEEVDIISLEIDYKLYESNIGKDTPDREMLVKMKLQIKIDGQIKYNNLLIKYYKFNIIYINY